MTTVTNPVLTRLGREGALGIGIPAAKGGSDGTLRDLFEAVAAQARHSVGAASLFAVQRHFAEVLLASPNIGLAEYRLGDILDGSISGACTATWPQQALPPLRARPAGAAWRLSGRLHPLPNVGAAWYLVTALLQPDTGEAPLLCLLSSEQDGLRREAVPSGEADDCAALSAQDVFFRADEILDTDTAQQGERLTRFASFLRCAIEAGRAQGAADRQGGAAAVATRSGVRHVIESLWRDNADPDGLPRRDGIQAATQALRPL